MRRLLFRDVSCEELGPCQISSFSRFPSFPFPLDSSFHGTRSRFTFRRKGGQTISRSPVTSQRKTSGAQDRIFIWSLIRYLLFLLPIYMYICMYVYIYIYIYVCIYVCVYICMYIYMYVCIYVCIYICMAEHSMAEQGTKRHDTIRYDMIRHTTMIFSNVG
ncbi:hypothetical protein EYC84_007936 [Monilinia fructicola]|uniref:Uncharacterized protein n=1 Tax=Monilinia fructicola TaxID=38448 RepID=A0A5M9JMD2_MONFR|nr:hypothetical protein EYC84_007936 [Monilinia fructicola]